MGAADWSGVGPGHRVKHHGKSAVSNEHGVRDWRRRLFLSSIFDGRRSAQGLSHWSWTRCHAGGRRVGAKERNSHPVGCITIYTPKRG